jgi:hypothetical protein
MPEFTCNVSLLIVMKLKAKADVCMTSMLLLYILQKYYLHKTCIFIENFTIFNFKAVYCVTCGAPTLQVCLSATLLLPAVGN